jgi:hypothetical protein
MSDPSVAETGLPPKRGWYDDPSGSGRDRWWNGYEWTEHTARRPIPSIFGPGYERAYRTRLNRPAAVSLWLAMGAAVLLLGGFFVATAPSPVADWVRVAMLVPQAALSIAAVVVGIAGVRYARLGGGLPVAISSIWAGVLSAAWSVSSLVSLIVAPVSS